MMNKEAVLTYATEVFGSTDKAERWLTKEKAALDGEAPMELLERGDTEEVLALLKRVANGYF